MKGSRATDYVNTVLWYVLLTLLQSAPAFATTTVTLSNAFIDEMRDRAIFDAVLLIDYAHDKAKPPAEDGDIHIAGWSPTVDLTTVAEIANAKKEKPAITRANEAEGPIREVPVSGVWASQEEQGHVWNKKSTTSRFGR